MDPTIFEHPLGCPIHTKCSTSKRFEHIFGDSGTILGLREAFEKKCQKWEKSKSIVSIGPSGVRQLCGDHP